VTRDENRTGNIYSKEGRGGSKFWVDIRAIAEGIRQWRFDIAGFVGYERAVVTAGGVDCDEVVAKTLESRLVPSLFFCGEVLDLDADTGGYNLHIAFATGRLAGRNACQRALKPRKM